MADLIDRQQAIDAIENAFDRETILNRFVRKIAISAVRLLPSAQPEPCEDAVNRETILKFFDGWMSALDENCHNQSVSDLKIIKRDFANLPPVTPKQAETECCADCKYDGYGRIGECARCCYSYASHFAHK